MLYDSLGQGVLIIVFLLSGFVSGFLFDAKHLFSKKLRTKHTFVCVFDFIATLLSCFVLFVTNLFSHYGIIRLFPILLFVSGIVLQRIISQKVFAFFFSKCYNHFVRKQDGKKK